MRKTTIYLVRHAEAENPNHIWYGRLPGFGLSKRGISQAEELKKYFAKKNISAIYTSPLQRTVQTAKAISDDKIFIKKDTRLNEIDYKKWEGLSAGKRPKEDIEIYKKNPLSINLGETLEECQKRMLDAISEIVKNNSGKNVIVVSHADPIIITRLSFKKKPLNLLNETSHLNAAIASLTFDDKLECIGNDYLEIVPAKKDFI